MGSILDAELREPAPPEGQPTTVGATDRLRGETTVTLLVPKSGGWEFGPEIKARASLNDFKLAAIPGSRDALYWSGIEVRIERAELIQHLPHFTPGECWVTASLLPSSYRWYVEGALLPGLSRRDKVWVESMRGLWEESLQLSQLQFDPFEEDPGFLIARLGDLVRSYWQLETGKPGRDPFHDARRPNRKSAGDREWSFGLSPAPPSDVVLALVQNLETYLLSAPFASVDIYPSPRQPTENLAHSPEGRVDRQERQEMEEIYDYRPGQDDLYRCLEVAAYQSLAKRTDSRASLWGMLRSNYFEQFRNMDQRIRTDDTRGARDAARMAHNRSRGPQEDLQWLYREFLNEHPECSGLPATRRCADLFRKYLSGGQDPAGD